MIMRDISDLAKDQPSLRCVRIDNLWLTCNSNHINDYLKLSDIEHEHFVYLVIYLQHEQQSEGAFYKGDQAEIILSTELNYSSRISDDYLFKVSWKVRPNGIKPSDSLVSKNDLMNFRPDLLLHHYEKYHNHYVKIGALI